MTFTGFSSEDEIFVNETALTDRGEPESVFEVKERDDQLEQFRDSLNTLRKGLSIQNILVSGQPGVGKTLITKLMADYVEEEAEKQEGEVDVKDLRVVYLNCSGKDSSYKIARSLVNKFRSPGEKIPATGYSSDYIYN